MGVTVEKPLTLPQAATESGISAGYLRVAANRGTLKATKIGRDWFVTREELAAFKATRRVSSD